MKILIVAYKFGTEKELGEHLGTYHYFIEIVRRLVASGHEIAVIAPWLSFSKKGSGGFDGVKVIRYYPPLWHKIWAFPFSRLLRFSYIWATQRQVLKFNKKEKPDAIFVWQARGSGYTVADKDKKNTFCLPPDYHLALAFERGQKVWPLLVQGHKNLDSGVWLIIF